MLPSAPTATEGKNPFDQHLASGAIAIGTTFSGEDRSSSEALSDYARSQAGSAVNSTVEGWLSQFGTVRSQINLGNDFSLSESSLDMLVPLYDSPRNMLFSQLGARRKDSRTTINVGAGVRFFPDETWMIGTNAFFDNDITGHNSRFGLGGELWMDYLKMSANGYQRLSGWHDSRDLEDYDERPANGFDLQVNAFLPAYPQLGGKLMYEQYYGDAVALFGSDDLQEDPYAVTVGVNYTPIPMLSLSAEQKMGKSGKNDFNLSMALTYQIDQSWEQNASPAAVDAMRKLARSRYDLVERNNNIVLEYRKQQVIKMHLAPEKLQGESQSTQTLTAQVDSKYGLKNIAWSGSSYLQAGGTIKTLDPRHFALTLPAWKVAQEAQAASTKKSGILSSDASRILNTYVLTAVAEGSKGNKSKPSHLTVEVLPPQAHLGSDVTVNGDNATPDGVSPVNVVFHVVDDRKKPLSGEPVSLTVTLADNSKTTKQVVSDASGNTPLDVVSTVSGEAGVVATLRGGESRAVKIHFANSEADAAHSSLTASPQSIVANDVATTTLMLTLHDSQDNPLTGLSGVSLNVSGLDGTRLSAVKETSAGVYTATLSGTQVGTATVTAQTAGKNLQGVSTTVLLTPDESSARINPGDFTVITNNVKADGVSAAIVQALVTDASGNPLGNMPVAFTATSGATITQSAVTNAQGIVRVPVTHTKLGAVTVTATVNGSSQNVQVNFIADKSSASGQLSVPADNAIANGIATNVVELEAKDAQGNAVEGINITFSATNGAVVATASGVTDEAGKLSTALTSTVAGASTVTAKTASGEVLSTTTTFSADTSTSTITSGDLSIVTNGSVANGIARNQVQVKVTDAKGNAVPAQTVTFSADNGALIETSGTTDSNGLVIVGLTSKKAGDSLVTASVNGHSQTINTTFVADNSTAKGALDVTADGAIANGVATNSVELTIQDASGNPVPGTSITFSATNGAKVTTTRGVTDKNGKFSTTATSTVAGISKVTATSASGEQLTANINFIADAGTATIVAGDLSVVTNGSVANGSVQNQIRVKVTDAQGNPVSAQTVSFTADNGAKIDASVTTNSQGLATAGLTSLKAGDSLVTATLNGQSQTVTTTFIADKMTAQGTLTVTKDGAIANGIATNSIELVVLDAGNNPVTGESITFSATNGTTVNTATSVTNSEGKASTNLTSLVAGSSEITATSNSGETLVQTVTFVADTGTATITSGDLTIVTNDSVANGSARNQVQVKVTDAKGNAVPAQTVTFSADNGAVIETSGTTDSSGLVIVGLTSKKAGDSLVTASVNSHSQTINTTFKADKSTLAGVLSVKQDDSVANGTATNSVQALISDANGNPIENEPVSFSANNGAIITPSVTTDANGIAVATLTNTRAGISTVTGSASGAIKTVETNFIADTSTAQIASGAMSILVNHSATDGVMENRVRVDVTDAFGNALSDQTVSFTASNGATLPATMKSDESGTLIVPVTSTIAGDSVITATINGSHQSVTLSFEADGNTAQIAGGSLEMITNDALANGIATNSVRATVTDASGNPVPDQLVSFSGNNNVLIAANGTTDSAGKVTVTLTSKTAGTSVIVATVNGSTQQVNANFVADSHTALIVSGSLKKLNDGAIANGTAANRVVMLVSDENGNALADQTVSFTASNGATIASTATTDADGALSLPVTSTVAGASTITASINGSSQNVTVNFVYDQSTVSVSKLTILNDNVVANGTDTDQVRVLIKDKNGNLATNMSVGLSASNGAKVAATGTTDANGEYIASLTSLIAGKSQFTAEANGQSQSVSVNFVPDSGTAQIASGSLTVTRNNAVANGKDTNSVLLKVTDANGNALADQTVAFTADNGATIAPDGVSGSDGTLSVPVTSTVAGEDKVTASINGSSQSVTMSFSYDAETATVSTLSVVDNNALANGTATNSVKAVVLDAQGNAVPDVAVTFSADNGATITVTGISNEKGEAVATLTSLVAGNTVVNAEVNGHSEPVTVIFTADSSTAQIAAASMTVTKDNSVADGLETNRVQLAVTDAKGNALAGQTVSFMADNGAKIVATAVTGAEGALSVPVTSTVASESTITATINGSTQSVKMNFKNDPSTAAIGSLAVVDDNAIANGIATNSVKAIVKDGQGNVVPDAVVSFSADNGASIATSGTSSEDGSLAVTLTNITAGTTTVTMTVNGTSQSIATTFIADGTTANIAASDIKVLTDNSAANGVKANQIQVIVKDANNNLVPDQTVSFTAAGATVASTGTTDSAGQITLPVTSTVAGVATLTATVNGSSQSKTMTFITDTATAHVAAEDFIVTKNNSLSDGVDANQVQARVTDAYGNIVSDALVSFSATNGAVVGDVIPTDAQGMVTVNITTLLPGISQITATISDNSQSVDVSFVAARTPVITAVNDVTEGIVGEIQSGQLTNEASPVLTGTADKNSTIRLYNNGKLVGSALADDSGNWSVKPDSPLTVQGNQSLTVTGALTPESPESLPTDAFILNLDSVNPTPKVTRVMDSSMVVAEGDTTTGENVVIEGTAEAGSTVDVYALRMADRVYAVLGTTTADESGKWSFAVTDDIVFQGSGEFSFQAKSTDAAGNSTKVSDCVAYSIILQQWPAPAGTPTYTPQSSGEVITADDVSNLLGTNNNILIISQPPAYAKSIELPAPSSANKGAHVYISIEGSQSTGLKQNGSTFTFLADGSETSWYSNGSEWKQVY
ncbi:Ig-like domain-containing protein [Rahnella woolbedingensis]|nr:Ig-like domain-containing protein [Rahnella woolbedingensis]